MKFYGTSLEVLSDIAEKLDLVIENPRRISKNCVAIKLTPRHSDHRYARRTAHGRRIKACSYEAFRDFIMSAFESGAKAVNTIDPTSTRKKTMDESTFRSLLPHFARLNVGSQAHPAYMGRLSNEAVPETVVKVSIPLRGQGSCNGDGELPRL